MREVAVALGRLAPDGRAPRWMTGSGTGIQFNPHYQQGVTLSAELSLANSAIEAAKITDDSNKKLAMLANLKVPEKGDYYRCGSDGAAVYDDKDLTMVAGKLGARKTVGPILNFASYRRDTSQDMFAGLAVQFLYGQEFRRTIPHCAS